MNIDEGGDNHMTESVKQKQERLQKKIDDATEITYINRLINHNKMQLANLRMELKSLMKEQKLLFNIKKMIKS